MTEPDQAEGSVHWRGGEETHPSKPHRLSLPSHNEWSWPRARPVSKLGDWMVKNKLFSRNEIWIGEVTKHESNKHLERTALERVGKT